MAITKPQVEEKPAGGCFTTSMDGSRIFHKPSKLLQNDPYPTSMKKLLFFKSLNLSDNQIKKNIPLFLPEFKFNIPINITVWPVCTFALVLVGLGFVLGVFRVQLLVPGLGERCTGLAEMPFMAAVIFFFAGYLLKRFPEVNFPGLLLVVGFIALALTICAELGLAVALQSKTLTEYLGSRNKVYGSVYLVLFVVFALMPRFRLPNHK